MSSGATAREGAGARAGAVLVGLAASGAGAVGSVAAPGPLIVDRDHVECPDAEFSSIAEAVQAAAPGDTIIVCPDRYDESVTVDKP